MVSNTVSSSGTTQFWRLDANQPLVRFTARQKGTPGEKVDPKAPKLLRVLLLGSQRLDRVHTRGVPGRKVAGERSRRDESDRHRSIRRRVSGLHPE